MSKVGLWGYDILKCTCLKLIDIIMLAATNVLEIIL